MNRSEEYQEIKSSSKGGELIHFHLYDPSRPFFGSKTDKAEITTVTCTNKDNCDLYKRGECALIGMNRKGCCYGQIHTETGYTRKARKFHSWIVDKKKKYADEDSLSSTSDKLCRVGDYIFLPYSHIAFDNKDVEFVGGRSGLFGPSSGYVHKDDFTIETIMKLVNHRPHAMMGGEITSYQKEELPKFLNHLKEEFKDLYEQLVKLNPGVSDITDSIDYVGRLAYIKSIEPGTQIKDKDVVWMWDGEFLTSTQFKPHFLPCSAESTTTTFKPTDDATIKITDNSQVTINTKFKN